MADPATDPFPTSSGAAAAFMSAPDAKPPDKPDNVVDLFPTKKQVEGATADLSAIQKQKIGAEDVMFRQFEQRESQNRERMERLFAEQGATKEDLKPWNAQQELEKRETSLWEQFGSPGFLIAMMGSAFSAMPMNSALSAGGAAITALNQGKMADYQRAFDAWKHNTDLTIQRQKMEHELYDEIDHLRATDLSAWHAKATAIATRFDDQRKLALLQNGMDPEVLQAVDAEGKAAKDLVATRDLIDERNRKIQYLNNSKDWTSGDPMRMQRAQAEYDAPSNPAVAAYNRFLDETWQKEGRAPTSEENLEFRKRQSLSEHAWSGTSGVGGAPTKAKEIAAQKEDLKKLHPEWTEEKAYAEAAKSVQVANAPPISGNRREQIEAHIQQYDLALEIVDKIDDTLNKYVGAAGVAGKATRLGERVSNIFGGNETDRVQLSRDIEELQTMAPALLLDRITSRPLSVEAGHISDVIAGLNMGDTTANTLRAYQEIKQRLTELRSGVQKRIGEPETVKPEAAPAGAGWDAYPEVQ